MSDETNATTEPTAAAPAIATETVLGSGLIQIERVINTKRIEGLPVIRGGRYTNVPFDKDQAVFAVDAVTAAAAVRTGSFREVPGGKTRLK